MNDIVKLCQTHGALSREQVIKTGTVLASGKHGYACKACRHAVYKRHYEKNAKEVVKKTIEYKHKNPEKVREIKKNWVINNRERVNALKRAQTKKPQAREAQRKRQKKSCDVLSDGYIKKLLCKSSTLTHHDLPKSLIEFKRVIIQMRRKLRDKLDLTKIQQLEEKLDENQSVSKNNKHRRTKGTRTKNNSKTRQWAN